MLIDTHVSWSVLILAVLCLIFPFLADLEFPLFGGAVVRSVENLQALLLLIFAVFSYFYMQPMRLSEAKKYFWIWAVLWWLLLLGRSTSWGRDYFPDVPKVYFRGISVVLIGSVVFMLLIKPLRYEISVKMKSVTIPAWAMLLAVLGLIISDGIEHSRTYGEVFLHQIAYKDLMEELYEFPLILGLFMVAFHIMQRDKQDIH
ncbi:hypothetical protein CDG62_07460 [Acinetobacter sp. WCHA55]|uniref:hypothetical protein n=1 Tax=Acinetobacter sp. WCHA55 TaxID=2004646 RepID=UPI000B3C9C59|nr:hypothetical protein [Acinetobacter sp. WCHA55]AYA68183.1 hypothetical protein CDG62_07460 [Acinetobacter sp. WCHA55]